MSGAASGCVLAVCWTVLVAIAFDPKSWGVMFPVAMIAIGVFYAAWRYTRVTKPATGESGVTASEPRNKLVQMVVDEYTMIKDNLRDSAVKPISPGTTSVAGMGGRSLMPALYEFDYAKEDGEISSRRVFVQSTSYSGGRQYLEGICKTRNAHRTFRVDRVIGSMTRVDDGRQLRASELFAASTPKPAAVFTASPYPSTSRKKREWETAVFFAGFGAAKRSELEELAEAAGWQVRSSITQTVDYVVTGAMAGSGQLAKAGELGIAVLDEAGFRGRV